MSSFQALREGQRDVSIGTFTEPDDDITGDYVTHSNGSLLSGTNERLSCTQQPKQTNDSYYLRIGLLVQYRERHLSFDDLGYLQEMSCFRMILQAADGRSS